MMINKIVKIVHNGDNHLLQRVNGHYNVVICEISSNIITIITDRSGMRPLFWYRNKDVVIVSNRVIAIKQNAEFKDEVNLSAMADFIKFNWVTNDATFFKNVNRFPSATVFVFQTENIDVTSYCTWPAQVEVNKATVEENAERGYTLLRSAVENVLDGVYFPGITLSGGLDSRMITGLIRDIGRTPFLYHCLTERCETLAAQGVAETYQLPLISEEILRLRDGFETFPLEFGDGCTSVAQFWLTKLLKRIKEIGQVDCIIDGFLLDLLFNLYGFFIDSYQAENGKSVRFLTVENKRDIADRIYGLPKDYLDRYFKETVLGDINLTALKNVGVYCSKVSCSDVAQFSRMLYLLTRGKRYVYMMSFVNKAFCEKRFPGLDYNVIDFGMSLPVEHYREPKVYLMIFRRYFPELCKVLWAKTGMPLERGKRIPSIIDRYSGLLRHALRRASHGIVDFTDGVNDNNYLFRRDKVFRQSVISLLEGGYCIRNGIIRRKKLVEIFESICSGRNEFGILERLITVEFFFRRFSSY
jgi:hypothetical protein